MYVPQPIAVHTVLDRQNFRKGQCKPYKNIVLYNAPNFVMPNILLKRAVSGASAVATLVDLDDNDIYTLTIPSQVNWPLDEEGEYECCVLGAGNWAGSSSLMTGGLYYLRIEAGTETYYTDEFQIQDSSGGFPIDCDGETVVKVTWVLDGTCIVSGKTSANEAEPIHGYPKTPLAFTLFWKANISQPEWEVSVEEGQPDAHGQSFAIRRSMSKRWALSGVPVSEGVVDALTSAALSDTVAVSFPDGNEFIGCKDIQTDVAWNGSGCSASARFIFTTQYLTKQGCC